MTISEEATRQAGGASERNAYSRGDVIKIIQSVIEVLQKQPPPVSDKLRGDLKDLAAVIERTRAELAQTAPEEIGAVQIPSATDELDAVVEATENASNTIMDACDAMTAMAKDLEPEQAEILQKQVSTIFEACSFQDITGQRITKVIGLLKDIEDKVGTLLDFVGSEVALAGELAGSNEDSQKLENGPQLPGNAMSQDDIDKLLDNFD